MDSQTGQEVGRSGGLLKRGQGAARRRLACCDLRPAPPRPLPCPRQPAPAGVRLRAPSPAPRICRSHTWRSACLQPRFAPPSRYPATPGNHTAPALPARPRAAWLRTLPRCSPPPPPSRCPCLRAPWPPAPRPRAPRFSQPFANRLRSTAAPAHASGGGYHAAWLFISIAAGC